MSNAQFWNSRASLGASAGSQDLIAAELERRAVLRYVKDGQNIVEVGCGTGTLAIEMARQHEVHVWGIDYSEAMLDQAGNNLADAGPLKGTVRFGCYDVTDTGLGVSPIYDIAVSVRCLINLSSWDEQRAAIQRILSWVKPGGLYIAVECVIEGLREINYLRADVGLPPIAPPSHNRYLSMEEVAELSCWQSGPLVDIVQFSGLYYLLSRLVNASVAHQAGQEPAYDSSINKLALTLPSKLTTLMGQSVLFVFQRREVSS